MTGERCATMRAQERPVAALEQADEAVFLFLHASRQADRDQRRDQRQRQHEGGASARITVSAIGSNILPSTPVKVRSGT